MSMTMSDMMTSNTTLGTKDSALGPPPGEVGGVRWVVWVGGPSHLHMPLDRGRCRIKEMDFLPTLVDTREPPLPCALVGEVPVLDPSRVLVRVSAFGPPPHLPRNLPVDVGECILTAHMPVIVRPPPDDRVELAYHLGRLAGDVPLEDAPNLGESSLSRLSVLV